MGEGKAGMSSDEPWPQHAWASISSFIKVRRKSALRTACALPGTSQSSHPREANLPPISQMRKLRLRGHGYFLAHSRVRSRTHIHRFSKLELFILDTPPLFWMNGACPLPMGRGPAVTPQTAIVSSNETNQRLDPCKPTASASMKHWHQNSLLEGTTPLCSYFLRWEAGEKEERLVHSALIDLPGQRKDTSQKPCRQQSEPLSRPPFSSNVDWL